MTGPDSAEKLDAAVDGLVEARHQLTLASSGSTGEYDAAHAVWVDAQTRYRQVRDAFLAEQVR